jgi:hypothetical protein
MKKIWKYIFYAVIALVLLYVIFGSTRERFTSVNPLPTAADIDALSALLKAGDQDAVKNKTPPPQIAANIVKKAPESIKSIIKFSRANFIPLLPYQVVKANTTPDGDLLDYWTLVFIPMLKDSLILPLAYSVKQQSSPPTLSAFIDMAVKTFRDNGPGGSGPLEPEQLKLIEDAKKGETTIQFPDGNTFPNPGYWMYKYIYGEPKSASSTPTSTSSRTSSGSIGGGGGGKCTPSVLQIPGGVTETRCFSS